MAFYVLMCSQETILPDSCMSWYELTMVYDLAAWKLSGVRLTVVGVPCHGVEQNYIRNNGHYAPRCEGVVTITRV